MTQKKQRWKDNFWRCFFVISPIQGRLIDENIYVGANPYVWLLNSYRVCTISVMDIPRGVGLIPRDIGLIPRDKSLGYVILPLQGIFLNGRKRAFFVYIVQ
jgi:hypothetical protein